MPFPALTRFTFGSMSLGRSPLDLRNDVAVARAAMEAKVWFHSSPTYNQGFTFMMLRMAFDEAPSQRPPLLVKIRDSEPRLLKFEVEDALRRLGVERLDLIQLVNMAAAPADIAAGFLARDARWELVEKLKREGKVGHAVLYVGKDKAPTARPALEQGLFDGVIFYSNLLQQDMADDLYDGLVSKGKLPALALRTVAGGLVAKDGSTPEEAKVAGKLERLRALAREHGCADLVELSVRFALSQPWMLTTIGGTRNAKHLRRFLDLAASGKPLPAAAVRAIEALRREP
jgi:aryl-alcohol dehydrogenase-like predicted oxidoreductase